MIGIPTPETLLSSCRVFEEELAAGKQKFSYIYCGTTAIKDET